MKVKDGIVGLVVGDALGVPVEFRRREELEKDPVTGMREHGTWDKPKGTWSDDSSMTIATMYSIVKKNGIDYTDIMVNFCKWRYDDKFSQDETFDIGNTTSNALINFLGGTPALESGGDGEYDNGNGSLMRILPMAYIRDIDFETVENMSSLTHAHEKSKIACALYVQIARSMLENDLTIEEHVKVACDKIKEHYSDSEVLHDFDNIFNNNLDNVRGRSYVIGSLECVIHCLLNTSSYRDAVLKAVNFGEDTDTTAAVCGGLAGIYYGFDSIPVDWIEDIPKIDKVIELCEKYEAFCDESQ